jgi:hypothetical protein
MFTAATLKALQVYGIAIVISAIVAVLIKVPVAMTFPAHLRSSGVCVRVVGDPSTAVG